MSASFDGKGSAIEVVYKFPKKAEEVISSMTITIGEKTIYGKIMEKKKAQEKYDDAIASGKAAVNLTESK